MDKTERHMIEKVTLMLGPDDKFLAEGGRGCDDLNPKELLLYAGAQCTAQTALWIMRREHIRPLRFEVSVAGELSTREVQASSVFRSFHVVYNFEVERADEQMKAGRAAALAHEKYCGMMQMLRKIAPLTHEIAVVSTEAEKEQA